MRNEVKIRFIAAFIVHIMIFRLFMILIIPLIGFGFCWDSGLLCLRIRIQLLCALGSGFSSSVP